MITIEQQDLAWACLPKETRDKIRKRYCETVNMGLRNSLCDLFGHHNLTSDTEPEEMLMVERKRVQEAYKHHLKYAKDCDDQWHSGIIFILGEIFGDKCLPDKELNEDNFAKSEPSVQGEPKFPIGSIVRITNKKNPYYGYKGRFGKVITYNAKFNRYAIDGISSEWDEENLELYTEPETKDNMEEKEFGEEDNFTTKELTLSDEELDKIIFEIIRIRDNRRENDRQLTEILAKFHEENAK